jgi:hypothetical protein
MSECKNPRCPIHGNGPEAKVYREVKARVVSSHELMAVIYILAANAIGSLAREPELNDRLTTLVQLKILRGELDSDPIVQGLINGFVKLLTDHRPTQEFFALCAQVPEAENHIKKVQERVPTPEEMKALLGDFLEELFGRPMR